MKSFLKNNKKKIIIITAICVAGLLIAGTATGAALMLNTNKLYSGIFVDDIEIGGLTPAEAGTLLSEQMAEGLDRTVTLICGETQKEIPLSELSASPDVEHIVNKAQNIGRKGNIFDRLKDIFGTYKTPVVLSPDILCDEAMLSDMITEMASATDQPGQEMQAEIVGENLQVTRGIPGNRVDIAKAIQLFKESALLSENKPIHLQIENLMPTEPTPELLQERFFCEPKNAEYKIENQRLSITEEIVGISFDVEKAKEIISQNPEQDFQIPLIKTQPEITSAKIEEQLFSDLLGSYSSRYNTGDVSRSHNVALASQNIHNMVRAPGDVFSYNDSVGPRTAARGFRTANVYVGNRVEPGIGGGICQVSSTLYNAVVLADLEIVTRTNHSLPVTYVPMGRDATVSYGSIDFKFKNNTKNPIRIVATAVGGTNKIAIYGKKENPARTVEITTQCIATRPFTVVQKEDPTLPEGTVKVEQKGAGGSTYNAYKITKENGVVIKNEFLAKSTYVPTEQIELIGTMPVASATPGPDEPTSAELPEATTAPEGSSIPTVTPAPTPVIPAIIAPNLSDSEPQA
ncbi:MAG: VanW family protein [Clostridia bacterium]|nr:VanW family protein [Clostridia bacterium]